MSAEAHAAALRAAASGLEPERVLRTLEHCLADWRSEQSAFRARLEREHGVFSPEVLRRGTIEGLAGWTAAGLRSIRERELPAGARTPGLTVVWLAGAIPAAAFRALVLPLAAGSAVYARTASVDPLSAALLLESLRSIDPGVAGALAVGRDDAMLGCADAVIAHGADATIALLRARLEPRVSFAAHGHKLSAAAVGPEVESELAAEAAALDLALYDGRGCLSPAFILVQDTPRGRALAFATALARSLTKLSDELPRGPLSSEESAGIWDRRARAAMRPGTRVLAPDRSSAWSVILEPPGADPAPGSLRSIPVIPIRDLAELETRCAAWAPHLSSLGHAGWDGNEAGIAAALLRGGGSRSCDLGSMQLPPLDWHHDGEPPMRSLFRTGESGA